MSYDLYLRREQGLNAEEFTAYFANRPNYTCGNGQTVYENQDTGVYFTFDLSTGEPAEEDEDDSDYAVSFNLNYYRPHFFGLEAAPELDALIKHFGLGISDPQNRGMGDGPFSVEGFLRGWNAGNEFGCSAVLSSEGVPPEVRTRPTAELEAIWRWNFERERRQKPMEDDVFVPRIIWLILDGELFSAVAWPDGIPAVIPPVEMLIVGRDELAPKRFLRKAEKDHCFIPRTRFEIMLAPLEDRSWAFPCHFPRYKVAPPPELRKFIERLETDLRKPTIPSMDSVLNRELVERTRKPR